MKRALRVGPAFVLATTLALLSVYVERLGPERVQYSNLCPAKDPDPCFKPAMKAGFPFAYLSDAPGVSRERQLAFFEDNLDAGALVLDIAVYFAVCMLVIAIPARLKGKTC